MHAVKRTIFVLLFSIILFSPSWAQRSVPSPAPIYYRVQKGDHLADILRKFGIKFLWGPIGAIEYTIRLNPQLHETNGNELPVGEFIQIPSHIPVASKKGGSKNKETRSVSSIAPIENEKAKPIFFKSSEDRHYEVVLIENDGKTRHKKLEFPVEINIDKKTQKHLYSIKAPPPEVLQKAADKKVPHFKDDYYALKKTEVTRTPSGEEVKRTHYVPWNFVDMFFFHFEGGGLLSSYSATSPQGIKQNISSNPSLFASGRTGFKLNDHLDFFLHGKGEYITLKANSADLSNATLLVPKVGAGARWNFYPKWSMTWQGSFTRDHVFEALANQVEVTGIWRSMSTVFVEYDAWKNGPHHLSASLGTAFYLSKVTNDIRVENTLSYFLEARYRLVMQEKIRVGSFLKIESRKQESNFGEDQGLKFNLGLQFDWN